MMKRKLASCYRRWCLISCWDYATSNQVIWFIVLHQNFVVLRLGLVRIVILTSKVSLLQVLSLIVFVLDTVHCWQHLSPIFVHTKLFSYQCQHKRGSKTSAFSCFRDIFFISHSKQGILSSSSSSAVVAIPKMISLRDLLFARNWAKARNEAEKNRASNKRKNWGWRRRDKIPNEELLNEEKPKSRTFSPETWPDLSQI